MGCKQPYLFFAVLVSFFLSITSFSQTSVTDSFENPLKNKKNDCGSIGRLTKSLRASNKTDSTKATIHYLRIKQTTDLFDNELYQAVVATLLSLRTLTADQKRATLIGLLIVLQVIIFLSYRNYRQKKIIGKQQLLQLQNEKRLIISQAELDTLKLQISPHFLFNNFSTLSALIAENQDRAVDFVTHLSSTYRYILTNANIDTIALKDEIDFIYAYLFLYQIRYGDALAIAVDIPDIVLNKKIAPVTLQLLVENAIKHNIVSLEHILTISIYTCKNSWICVKNNKQLKKIKPAGTDTGLKNIKDRYLLMGLPDPVIIDDDDFFIVEIPLI